MPPPLAAPLSPIVAKAMTAGPASQSPPPRPPAVLRATVEFRERRRGPAGRSDAPSVAGRVRDDGRIDDEQGPIVPDGAPARRGLVVRDEGVLDADGRAGADGDAPSPLRDAAGEGRVDEPEPAAPSPDRAPHERRVSRAEQGEMLDREARG